MTPATAHDLQAANRLFEAQVAARNFDAIEGVYTQDATILPPGGEKITGRDHIKAFWKGAVEGLNVSGCKLETVEFHQAGDMGYEIGKAVLSFASGAPDMSAKYVVVWKQEDGAWKWHVDIWNANA